MTESLFIFLNMALLVHITGPSGAGKTTLGNLLRSPTIAVYDTDEFLQEHVETNEERDKVFDIAFARAIEESNDKSIIVFTGLLDHGSSDGHIYSNINFDVKLFLVVPPEQLIKQYYGRVMHFIETQPEILAFVVKAEEWILSSIQVLEGQKHNYEDYVERLGYTPKTATEIIEIIEMLNHI